MVWRVEGEYQLVLSFGIAKFFRRWPALILLARDSQGATH
jgi:hypothetical protein